MRTAGLTLNDVWADRVLREHGVETYRYEKLAAESVVLVESVELKHRSPQENYRPYLHLTGELRSITPATMLPYGISQVTYSPGQGEKITAFYEFDDEQLVVLAGKGYFSNTFSVPEQIIGIEWELPVTVDTLVLAPSAAETDAPVVFTHVHDIAALEIDLESSGYDLTDYFADHSQDGVTRTHGAVIDERGLRARSDAINSLFTEQEIGLAGQEDRAARPAPQAETTAAGLGSRLQQIEALIAAEHVRYQADRARTAGTTENLYHEHVVQPQRITVEPPPSRPARAPDSGLEREKQEAQPEPVRPSSTVDERTHRDSRRAITLDGDQDNGYDLGS